ncbi:hypothetical protein SKAU_G00204270 [Synaphobranchus kaupii]|uniref:Uncharacterized protein n=1 Tax=Synaphobranchus kaupii TaxID=118154 RepID=A0A9Q1FG30_SYNKA|nr:hypothetical protein SKAU_G00204270 [Synaphobranchus kaupii]
MHNFYDTRWENPANRSDKGEERGERDRIRAASRPRKRVRERESESSGGITPPGPQSADQPRPESENLHASRYQRESRRREGSSRRRVVLGSGVNEIRELVVVCFAVPSSARYQTRLSSIAVPLARRVHRDSSGDRLAVATRGLWTNGGRNMLSLPWTYVLLRSKFHRRCKGKWWRVLTPCISIILRPLKLCWRCMLFKRTLDRRFIRRN